MLTRMTQPPGLPAYVHWSIFPFTGDLVVKEVESATEEPARAGDPAGPACPACTRPDGDYLWTDEQWRLSATAEPAGLPFIGQLEPREHHDLDNLPAELTADLGRMMVRLDRAVTGLGGVARVHFNRWGDGTAHLHWWVFARPEGMLQLRGVTLPLWNEIVPRLSEAQWKANLAGVADTLAAEGGTSHRPPQTDAG